MASAPTVPAKLSRPRLFDIAPRERLFARLDACRAHPAIWIDGPAGAGKTSLLAGYIEARGLAAQWYQVDGGDADLATFFYYLRALPGLAAEQPALPLFTAEYQNDAPAFARRFFRALYAELGQTSLLVLDNVQEAAGNPDFAAILREAIEQVPDGVNLLLVSRWEPPPTLARLLTQQAIARLGWPELQLSAEETGAIAGLEPGPDSARIAGLQAACGGWAAGLTLMLARPPNGAEPADARQASFDFLAAEIFDRSDAATGAFLLASWPLPRLTPALAGELTGHPDAAGILGELFRHNYFIERHPGPEASFQYHALFREFLAARARRSLPAGEFNALLRRAAELLEAAGEVAEAFTLLQASGAADDCRRLIVAHGESLARCGRLQTLRGWIDSLPAELIASSPWLAYWRGCCDLGSAPATARRFFSQAVTGFAAAGDELGGIKAIVGVIDTCYAEWSDFSALDPWIAQLVARLDQKIVFPDAAAELQAVAAALVALLYRQPTHPRLPELAARAHALLDGEIGANERVAAGTYLLNGYNWMGESGKARQVIALVSPDLAAAELSPLRHAWWSARLAYHHYIAGEPQATVAALEAAAAIARDHSQPVVKNIVLLYTAFHHLSAGELAAARQALDAFEQRLSPNRRLDCAIACYQRAWLALLEENLGAALKLGGQAVELATQAGVPNVQAYFLLLVAFVHAARGEAGPALSTWESAHQATDPQRFPLFEFTARLVRAELARQTGDGAAGRQALRSALVIGARHDYANNLLWLPAMLSQLCAQALDWDIEAGYVRRLIRRRGLLPPGPQAKRWPWPLRIYTLGAFRVERQGETIRFSGKAQKRPLALLMALIAHGGREINAGQLAELLWPDADGDAARAALGTALYRLRHLLDTEQAILLGDGKLSLNPQCVWVDRWAFEALAEASAGAEPEALFELYGGHFLEHEEEQPWMLLPREHLKTTLRRAVEANGRRLEQAENWELASRIYERGIALDQLAESLYRRLMFCQAKLDRTAQAIETYRRCRQALSVVLGIAPAAETEALRRSLG